jgi:hypothetical protein
MSNDLTLTVVSNTRVSGLLPSKTIRTILSRGLSGVVVTAFMPAVPNIPITRIEEEGDDEDPEYNLDDFREIFCQECSLYCGRESNQDKAEETAREGISKESFYDDDDYQHDLDEAEAAGNEPPDREDYFDEDSYNEEVYDVRDTILKENYCQGGTEPLYDGECSYHNLSDFKVEQETTIQEFDLNCPPCFLTYQPFEGKQNGFKIFASVRPGDPTESISLRVGNVWNTGLICFGDLQPRDLREAYNAFWASEFNGDLTISSDLSELSEEDIYSEDYLRDIYKDADSIEDRTLALTQKHWIDSEADDCIIPVGYWAGYFGQDPSLSLGWLRRGQYQNPDDPNETLKGLVLEVDGKYYSTRQNRSFEYIPVRQVQVAPEQFQKCVQLTLNFEQTTECYSTESSSSELEVPPAISSAPSPDSLITTGTVAVP